ncbi:MAG: GNAT family N-acetyltransferase [Alphaproteobacteria bacterium]|nr:GNAT family N-acetyltransferase [Alphaproteobacteria bacterium]
MTQIEVRPLVADDEDKWRRLWRGYLDFYLTSVPDAVYDSSFRRVLSGNAGAAGEFRGLVATVDGAPAGLAHFLFHRHGWSVEDVCYLQDLFVAEEHRGLGLGRKLIEAVYAAADAAGAAQVYWLTQDFNETARRLYDRIGVVTPFIKYNRR